MQHMRIMHEHGAHVQVHVRCECIYWPLINNGNKAVDRSRSGWGVCAGECKVGRAMTKLITD